MLLTELQHKVFDAARASIKDKPWFRGVCLDRFPSDGQITADFQGAVDSVTMKTAMWDDPNFYRALRKT